MSKTTHNFNQSKKVGDVGQHEIKKVLDKQYYHVVDVTEQKAFYEPDIDYICIDEELDTTFVELKTDTYTARNNRIFLETWSNVENESEGWPYYTEADLIYYYALNSDDVYVFKNEDLEKLMELFLEEGEQKEVWNKNYTSEGYVLNIKEIPDEFYELLNVSEILQDDSS